MELKQPAQRIKGSLKSEDVKKVPKQKRQSLKRIETMLHVKVWQAQRESGCKLFNFHSGF